VQGTISGNSTSFVDGPLGIRFSSGSATAKTFHIGKGGGTYRTIVLTPEGGGFGSNTTITVEQFETSPSGGSQPGTLPTGIAEVFQGRYWTMTQSGYTTGSYSLQVTYTGTGYTEARNKILLQSGGTSGTNGITFSVPATQSTTATTVTATGLSSFPTATGNVLGLGKGGATMTWDGGGGSSSWKNPLNWSTDDLPTSVDDVTISGTVSVTVDSAAKVSTITVGDATNFATLTLASTGINALRVFTNAGTPIVIRNASKMIIPATNAIRIDATDVYDANRTDYQSGSTIEFQGGVVESDDYANLIVNSASNLSTSSNITVSGTYTKQGVGSHTMSSANMDVTGTSTISGGTLALSGTGSLTLGTVSNSGTIDFGGSAANSLGSYSGSGTVTAGGAGSITFSSNVDFGGNATFGSQTLIFQSDVTVTGGALTLSSNSSFTGNSKDFEINGGSVVTSSGTLTFQTGTGQTITGAVTFPSLTMNNSNGVTISSGSLPTVTGTLTLTNGLINFATSANYVTLNSAASVSGGSSSSFVNGKVRKIFATGSNVSGVLPVGKPTGRYQPVTLSVGTVTGAGQYIIVEQIETNIVPPLTTGINVPLVAVSRIRYWNVTYTANGGSMTNPTIQLSWDNNGATGIADGVAGIVGTSTSADVVIARQSNGTGNWSNLGQSAFTGTYANGPNTNTGTVTSSTFTLTDGNSDFVTFGALNSDVSLPVELTLFEAAELENVGHVQLIWRTESEIENAYWLVQKKTLNGDFTTVATIEGQGTKSSSTDYKYVDTDVKAGDSVSYRLGDVAYNGDVTYHSEKALRLKVPERFELLPNYPNPFNPTTTISYKLPKQSRVSLTIYNILGQKVRELVRGEVQDAGVQRAFWDSRNDAGSTVATGIYIYRLQIGGFHTSRKMILMK
jgi:hypothetical protein